MRRRSKSLSRRGDASIYGPGPYPGQGRTGQSFVTVSDTLLASLSHARSADGAAQAGSSGNPIGGCRGVGLAFTPTTPLSSTRSCRDSRFDALLTFPVASNALA